MVCTDDVAWHRFLNFTDRDSQLRCLAHPCHEIGGGVVLNVKAATPSMTSPEGMASPMDAHTAALWQQYYAAQAQQQYAYSDQPHAAGMRVSCLSDYAYRVVPRVPNRRGG